MKWKLEGKFQMLLSVTLGEESRGSLILSFSTVKERIWDYHSLWSTLVDVVELTRDYGGEILREWAGFLSQKSHHRELILGVTPNREATTAARSSPIKGSFWEPYNGSHQIHHPVGKALSVLSGESWFFRMIGSIVPRATIENKEISTHLKAEWRVPVFH